MLDLAAAVRVGFLSIFLSLTSCRLRVRMILMRILIRFCEFTKTSIHTVYYTLSVTFNKPLFSLIRVTCTWAIEHARIRQTHDVCHVNAILTSCPGTIPFKKRRSLIFFFLTNMPNLRLGSIAPDFEAETTTGHIKFHDWIGDSWVCLLSTFDYRDLLSSDP